MSLLNGDSEQVSGFVRLTVPAHPGSLAVVHTVVAALGARAGLTIDDLDDLTVAAEESVLTRIGAGAGVVELAATVVHGEVALSVSSDGDAAGWPPAELEAGLSSMVLTGLASGVRLSGAATVRTPRRVRARQAEALQAIDRLTQRLGRSPTVAEIAAEAGITEEAVLEGYSASRFAQPASIEELATVGAALAAPADQDDYVFVEDWMTVAPALAELSARERQILYLRFYRELNQKQVAAAMGLSQAHVSRLITQAFQRLRGVAAG